MGLFDKLKQGLQRTRAALSDGLSGLFRGGRPIDEALLAELEELLYTSDLGALAGELCAELARLHKRGELKGEADVRAALRRMLLERLGPAVPEPDLATVPTVLMICGVNGSGKTTSIAKLAWRTRQRGATVLVGACDTFRAAAADQLEIWAARSGVEIVRQKHGADPAAVAYDSVDAGIARGVQAIILDTAGRLHTQKNLMEELRKVQRVVGKRLPGAPHEVWLVIDATNGQNAIAQAREFTSAVQVTGLIVAKLDGTARGGALFTIRKELGLPVRYIGTGEQMDALLPFDPQAFVDAILSTELAFAADGARGEPGRGGT
ncbi:MAG: signal recognition particle-docking protein FtsY [Planctomycetes bacterium]|nr:signal recognition particle-docking protein FtsY [Planctomycetota bacterium]